MKKFLAVISIVFLSSILAFSQTETTATPDWQKLAPENEEFSIDVPVALSASVRESQNPQNKGNRSEAEKSRRYQNTLNGTYFYIFSDDWKTPEQFTFATNFGFSKQAETTQKSGDLTLTRYEFSDDTGFYHTIVGVRGTNRAYIFQTISPSAGNPLVERFFSSLKINQKPLLENLPAVKAPRKNIPEFFKSTEPNSRTDSKQTPEARLKTPTDKPEDKEKKPAIEAEKKVENVPDGNGIGSGNGAGQGFGIGNGRGGKTETENNTAPTKFTSAVKVLSKPRANYTDYARFYQIQGRVVLRVTFAANGAIGSITPIARLPFGLTEEAITAARAMKFEPAMREGVPVSVTKPVEYNFYIY